MYLCQELLVYENRGQGQIYIYFKKIFNFHYSCAGQVQQKAPLIIELLKFNP